MPNVRGPINTDSGVIRFNTYTKKGRISDASLKVAITYSSAFAVPSA